MSDFSDRPMQHPWILVLLFGLVVVCLISVCLVSKDTHGSRKGLEENLTDGELVLLQLGRELTYREFVSLLNGEPELIATVSKDPEAIFRLIQAGLPSNKAACVAYLEGCPSEARLTLVVFDAPRDLALTSGSQIFHERVDIGNKRLRVFELEGQPKGLAVSLKIECAEFRCQTWLPEDPPISGILFQGKAGVSGLSVIVNGETLDCHGTFQSSTSHSL